MKVSFNNSIGSYSQNSNKEFLKNNRSSFYGVDDVAFNGKLTKFTNIAAEKLAESKSIRKLVQNKRFNNFLKSALENPGLFEALIALGITCTLRPLAILAVPGAKLEDKQYASAQSVSSGISGLGFAYAVYKPIEVALDNIKNEVNHSNIKKSFLAFYDNSANKTLIEELTKKNIIPDREQFEQLSISSKNILKTMSNYLKENGQLANIQKTLTGDNVVQKTDWKKLAKNYSTAIQDSFDKIKFNNVAKNNRYMVYEAIKFGEDGKYISQLSKAAAKTNFLLNYSSKFVFAPLLALLTIATLSKLVKYMFGKNKKSPKPDNSIVSNRNFVFAQNLKPDNKSKDIFKDFMNNNVLDKTKPQNVSFSGKVNLQNSIQNTNKNTQVSFSGGNPLSEFTTCVYNNCYGKPVSNLFTKIYQSITSSKIFSNWINKTMNPETTMRYGQKLLKRGTDHKILSKFDSNFYLNNLPQIVSLWLSSFYIINTMANKDIEESRKPTLCANMGIVALLSLSASKGLEKLLAPIKNSLIRVHKQLMKNKVSYDIAEGWNKAYQLGVVTFAFRFMGPVVATPLAAKLMHFLEKNKIIKPPKQNTQKTESKK